MKVLAIVGSPRKKGNTAEILKFVLQASPKSWKTELIFISDFKINGCQGCSYCQNNIENFTCVQKDDGNLLLKKLISADIILYGTPLYGHNYSGQLKIFLDRHLPLFKFVSNKDKAVNEMKIISKLENKLVSLIVSCQGPEQYNTEIVQMLFDKFCESSLTKCCGKYIFPFCQTNYRQSQYSQEVIQNIWQDILKKI